MNRKLAEALSTLNSFLAWVIIIIATVIGLNAGGFIYALAGVGVGVLCAIFICGFLSLLIEIWHELTAIRELLEDQE